MSRCRLLHNAARESFTGGSTPPRDITYHHLITSGSAHAARKGFCGAVTHTSRTADQRLEHLGSSSDAAAFLLSIRSFRET
jgi:hypothetical protein